MAIGIRYPQGLPSYNGITSLTLIIDAPNGTQSSNKVGALIQEVSQLGCVAQPWLALTDCMGLSSLPTTQPLNRMVLNQSRGWVGPPLCWTSDNYGTTTPYLQIPSKPGGCY